MDDLRSIMSKEFTNYIGSGSSASHIVDFKEAFPGILKKYKIKSVNDAGCGLGWVRNECNGIDYSGFDILKREGAEILDITSEVMPKADLILCRDVMLHLTNDLARKAIDNFKQSGKYLLATSYKVSNHARPAKYNGSVINSFINLTEFLGTPITKIVEPIDNRYIGLWELNV